ncbi:MAG: GntR family transcriptional regulator [Hydrogenophaga sp.]|jgi:GntR family transcriptional regulator|nr:GntR family transcriptional regulator [Hydrogenophaga sp.]
MDAQLPLPKYHQIYLVLRQRLRDGQFDAGLPGELALMEQFGVARVTVRRALMQLAEEGLIRREPGRGTRVVRPQDLDAPMQASTVASARQPRLTGLLENLVAMGMRTKVKVLAVERLRAPADVAEVLRLSRSDWVQKAERVRSTADGPLSHITTWVPDAISSGFGKRELTQKPLLVLLEESGVKVGRAEQTISARLADVAMARHLDVAVGSALLAVRRLIYDEDDRPVQWLHGLYRPDRYEYQMQLSRVGGIDAKVWVSQELSANFH